jgi:hypothetical protein
VFISDRVKELGISESALLFWNKNLNKSGYKRYDWFVSTNDKAYSDAQVGLGQLGLGESGFQIIGKAYIPYNRKGGITNCKVVLSIDYAYDRHLMEECLKHELGHCLGLMDDMGSPKAVDLNSIMSDPVAWKGVLTRYDYELLIMKRFGFTLPNYVF